MRYLIKLENDLFGWNGHISVNSDKKEISKYAKRFGYASAASAREDAQCMGYEDVKIIEFRV